MGDGFDLSHGTYVTPSVRPSTFARWSPSTRFYFCFMTIVARCANMARRGVYDDERWLQSSHDTRRCLERAGVRLHVTGLEHVRDLSGPCVYVCNHMSMLETVVLPGFIRIFQPVTYVVKDSLVNYPFFKEVLLSRNPIVVGRVDPRADFQVVMKEGRDRLEEGISVIVFPQTTRTKRFSRKRFNSIGVKLARRAGVPVIPVALRTDAWALSKRFIKDLGRIHPETSVHFAFGEPVDVAGRGGDAHDRTLDFIEGRLNGWGLPSAR